MAKEVGVSRHTVHTIWKRNDLKPHRTRTFKLSKDPKFEQKFWDVIGLYLHPRESARALPRKPSVRPGTQSAGIALRDRPHSHPNS